MELNLVEAGIGGKGRQGMTWDMVSVLFLGIKHERAFYFAMLRLKLLGTSHLYLVSGSFASFV